MSIEDHIAHMGDMILNAFMELSQNITFGYDSILYRKAVSENIT
jgi:hypothetical protein